MQAQVGMMSEQLEAPLGSGFISLGKNPNQKWELFGETNTTPIILGWIGAVLTVLGLLLLPFTTITSFNIPFWGAGGVTGFGLWLGVWSVGKFEADGNQASKFPAADAFVFSLSWWKLFGGAFIFLFTLSYFIRHY